MIMRTQDERLRELIAEQAAEWHVAHSEGALSPQQARAFMHWLRVSPAHVAEYLTIAALARDVSDAARRSTASALELASQEEEPVQPLRPERATPMNGISSPQMHRALSPRRPRRASQWPRARRLAAVAGLLVASLAVWVGVHWLGSNGDVQTFATGRGEERSLQLPDNTLVQLDSDSAITVRFDGNRRQVDLDRGQAFFKVFRDPERPFSVQVGDSLIRDIGTAFDVYRRKADTTITVAEGRVQVWSGPSSQMSTHWWSWLRPTGGPSDAPVADLRAGEQVRIASTGKIISRGDVDMQQALAWTRGRIAFDNEAVAQVAAEFNRYNNVRISMEDGSVGELPISGTFNVHDVSTFVAFLGTMPHVRVEKHGDHIFVGVDREKKRHIRE
jgi:transmembrane sensor